MTLRPLTEDEKKATENGIENAKKAIALSEEAVEYANKKLAFKKLEWEFEDYERPLSRKNTEDQANNTVTQHTANIEQAKFAIENMEKQLKEGVEVKDEKTE
jgi:hypothetical protein